MRALDSVRLQQWERSHLTLPQLRVLHQLRRTPGLTTGELARQLGVTVSTASGLILKLVQRRLVERSSGVSDRRLAALRLTPTGEEQVGELAEGGREFLARVAAALGDDLWGVTIGLERLAGVAEHVRWLEASTGEIVGDEDEVAAAAARDMTLR